MSNTKMKSNPLVFLWKTTTNRLLQYKISHKIEYTSTESEDSNQLTATNLNIPWLQPTLGHLSRNHCDIKTKYFAHVDKYWISVHFSIFNFLVICWKKRVQKIEHSILPDTHWLFLWSMDVTKLSNWQIWASSDNMFASQYLQIDGVYESQHGERKKRTYLESE